MEQNHLIISYDPVADVLYISFGQPQPAISHETEDGILVRCLPDTQQVVGLTIIDFAARFATCGQELSLPVIFETPNRIFPVLQTVMA